MNLGVREMYLKINIDGENTEAFSARTMNVPKLPYDHSKDIWNLSTGLRTSSKRCRGKKYLEMKQML